jgi:ABC-type Zn2+ transport system substrate-binding protein/surface adhesin
VLVRACYRCDAIAQQAIIQPAAAAVTSTAAHSGCNHDHSHTHSHDHTHSHNHSSTSGSRHVHGSSAHKTHITAALITVSDTVANGSRSDGSGPAMRECLSSSDAPFTATIAHTSIVPDEVRHSAIA